MTKNTPAPEATAEAPTGAILTTNDEVAVAVAPEVETVVSDIGGIKCETFVGVQTDIAWVPKD